VSEEGEKGAASSRHPGGRPTDYKPEFMEIAANLCAAGATDFEVAQALDCGVSTLYAWKARHPEFREAMRAGKELADDRVEASLYHRAVGYSHPAVKIFMPASADAPVYAAYTEHVPPDVGAATLWLTNRKGDQWRSKQALEHTGPNGGPLQSVTITTDDPVEATRAWQEMIRGS
jgi:hypothetical protein